MIISMHSIRAICLTVFPSYIFGQTVYVILIIQPEIKPTLSIKTLNDNKKKMGLNYVVPFLSIFSNFFKST